MRQRLTRVCLRASGTRRDLMLLLVDTWLFFLQGHGHTTMSHLLEHHSTSTHDTREAASVRRARTQPCVLTNKPHMATVALVSVLCSITTSE